MIPFSALDERVGELGEERVTIVFKPVEDACTLGDMFGRVLVFGLGFWG